MSPWRRAIRWFGGTILAFGGLTILWSLVVLVQVQTGWGLNARERCCGNGGTLALALLVSGMFFFLVGAGVMLLSRMGLRGADDEPSATVWTRFLPAVLFVTGGGSIAIATVFAGMSKEFGEATIGIVSYCMLIGVGLLFAGWGLKRARDHSQTTL